MSRLFIIDRALKQRCEVEEDWSLKRLSRVGHTIKAIIAVALGREKRGGFEYRDNVIHVAYLTSDTWHSFEFGTMWDFTALVVAKGFRQWRYAIISDGSP